MTSMTQTPSASHHHPHQKEHQQQQIFFPNQQRQHQFQVQQNQQNLSYLRRNSAAACSGIVSGVASNSQQLHLDPLSDAEPASIGMISDSQQILQPPVLPQQQQQQQQQHYTSSSMVGSNNYPQSSLLQRNALPNENNSVLSTISKQYPISHNMESSLQHVPGGKLCCLL